MFDVDKTRAVLLGAVGIERYLARDFESAREKRSLTRTASSIIRVAIECVLVGFDKPAYRLFDKAREWLVVAIADKEVPKLFTAEGIEPMRFDDFALCNWLLAGRHDGESLNQAATCRDRNMETKRRDKVTLDLTLPSYLDAGKSDRAIELFETTPGFSSPKTLSQVRTQARMVYVLCKHQRNGIYTDGEMRGCLRRFLSSQLDQWLDEGHCSTIARWMKIAHWDRVESRESAREALLHCYDYLQRGRES